MDIKLQVLRLSGELSFEDSINIKHLISEYLKGGVVHVIINVSAVNHIHLSAFPIFVERAKRLREYGGDLKFAGASQYLKHSIELTGADKELNFYENEEEAEKAFGSTEEKNDKKLL